MYKLSLSFAFSRFPVHGGRGYLLVQFRSPYTNRRTDILRWKSGKQNGLPPGSGSCSLRKLLVIFLSVIA